MRDLSYFATLTKEDGEITVAFPDVPEVVTSGVDERDALYQAADALGLALSGRLSVDEALPERTAQTGHLVSPLMDDALHLQIILHARNAALSAAELAALLGVGPRKAERLLDPLVPASVRFMERALHKLGIRPSLHQIEPAADAAAPTSAATPETREV